jgi:hypothetical protein
MSAFQNINYINLTPFLTIILIIIGIIAAVLINPGEFNKTRTSVFISIMGSIAVIMLSFNVFLTSTRLENDKIINNAQLTKQSIDKLWLYPNELLHKESNARPEFLASLYYNNITLYNLTKNLKTKPSVKSELTEQYISIVLIQCWEDYLTFHNLDKTGVEVWLCNFLQWAQSPYLKANFDNLKYNFASKTIEFGKLLFEYAAHIPIPETNPEVYRQTVSKLQNDPRILDLLK